MIKPPGGRNIMENVAAKGVPFICVVATAYDSKD
jgi:hypothetical protein